MLELEIRCRYTQAPLQQSVIVGTYTSPLTMGLLQLKRSAVLVNIGT